MLSPPLPSPAAPHTSWLHRLTICRRLLLLAAAFTLPLGAMLTLIDLNKDIAFARRELDGNEYQRTGQQMSLDKVRPTMEANEAFIKVVVDNQTKRLEEDIAQSTAAYDRASWTGLALLTIGLSVAGLVGWVVHSVNLRLRRTAAELKQGSEQVVSAASQVATSSQSLSQGATEQAASLEETSASMEEMASMTRKTSENAHQAADARQRRGAAGRGVERGAGRHGHVVAGAKLSLEAGRLPGFGPASSRPLPGLRRARSRPPPGLAPGAPRPPPGLCPTVQKIGFAL